MELAIGAAKKHSESIKETYEWTKAVSLLLMCLIDTLSYTVAAWENFGNKYLDYFMKRAGRNPHQHVPTHSAV